MVAIGPGVRTARIGDRMAVYHISGCGQCDDCVRGYQISCSSPTRAAYGWQRNGGHADLILATERDCVLLPDFVTFLDGACVACGFGTAYEGLHRLITRGGAWPTIRSYATGSVAPSVHSTSTRRPANRPLTPSGPIDRYDPDGPRRPPARR